MLYLQTCNVRQAGLCASTGCLCERELDVYIHVRGNSDQKPLLDYADFPIAYYIIELTGDAFDDSTVAKLAHHITHPMQRTNMCTYRYDT